MTFLTLLIVLLIERFWQTAAGVRRWRWLNSYGDWISKVMAKTPFKGVSVNYGLVILSLLILVLLVQRLLLPLTYYTWYYIFNFFVLFYCLGPENFYQSFGHQQGENTAGLIGFNLSEDVTRVNQCLFAPFFWFAALGVFGVLLYRVTERMPRNSLLTSAVDVLDWIPARILGFTFGLVSYFIMVFPVWLTYLFHAPKDNEVLLLESAKVSLGEDQNAVHFLALVDRSLIVWLVILALIVLL